MTVLAVVALVWFAVLVGFLLGAWWAAGRVRPIVVVERRRVPR